MTETYQVGQGNERAYIMGEIKSTLEIIMEKTKGMTLSENEKKELKQREIRGRVGGSIQKLIDGIIDLEEFKADMAVLGRGQKDLLIGAVMDESVSRITIGEENAAILKVFEVVDGIDDSEIKEILDRSNQELMDKRREREKATGIRLRGEGISGSAVIPNPDADPDWIDYVTEKEIELKDRLRSVTRKS